MTEPVLHYETPAIFAPMPKIARYSRLCTITEKIDGTNASIFIGDNGEFYTASRTKWITPEDDNQGFSRWANENILDLAKLGPGHHFGEWWGLGIQRRYGQTRKRFSLFNTFRWSDASVRPTCCDVVPVLFEGQFTQLAIEVAMDTLRFHESRGHRDLSPSGQDVFQEDTR
jgi:hypothetical protein